MSNDKCQLLIPAICAGWLTIPLTNFWGFSVVIVQILMFLLPAFAITINHEPITNKQTKRIHPFLLLLSCSPALILLIFIFRYWLADTYFATAQKQLRAFSTTQSGEYLFSAYDNYISAYQLNKKDPPITSELSLATAYMALVLSESQKDTSAKLIDTAISAGLQAVAISPYHPNYYKTLSRTYIILSTLDEKYLTNADDALAKAALISPTDPRIPYNRGVIAQYQKDYQAAISFFESSQKLRPQFAEPRVALEAIATLSADISSP